jgi:hypothetical protein
LGRYGLISLEPIGINMKVVSDDTSMFSNYPFLPVYMLKVIMASPLTSRNAIQSIALFASIPQNTLKFYDKSGNIVMDGAETEQHAHPVEVDSAFAQSEVGDKRAASLVSDMMKSIAAKRSDTILVPVYESSMATHHEVGKMLGQPVRRGYYLIEKSTQGSGLITGPLSAYPDNLAFTTDVSAVKLKETKAVDAMVEFAVDFFEPDVQEDPQDAGRRVDHKPMEVELVDINTGKEYTVVVRASSAETARPSAIEIIAAKTGIAKERFLPKSPEPV